MMNDDKNLEEKKVTEKDLQDPKYTEAYSDESFWEKVKKVAKKVGLKGIYYALLLYYTLQKKDLPLKDKAIIIAALGYFIIPVDLIPDITPLIGFTDDTAALLLALKKVSEYIDNTVKEQAKAKIKEWFKISDEELNQLF